MFQEFKEFISKGNVIDLAVGVIIGVAFSGIINSIVSDLLMPVIGILVGAINFTGLSITVGSAVLPYGKLMQAILNFLVIAFVLFLIVKSIHNFKSKKEDTPPPPTKDQELLVEIRDILKSQKSN